MRYYLRLALFILLAFGTTAGLIAVPFIFDDPFAKIIPTAFYSKFLYVELLLFATLWITMLYRLFRRIFPKSKNMDEEI